MNRESLLTVKKEGLPDPGTAPYCPKCGAPAQAFAVPTSQQFPNTAYVGVCTGCGIPAKLTVSVQGEVLPWLTELSDLAVLPPMVDQLLAQIRAQLSGKRIQRQ